ncbi:MAG: LysR family transcriptional regulator [Rhizomicrobium sp.]
MGSKAMERKDAKAVWGHTPNEGGDVSTPGSGLDWDEFRIFQVVARVGSFTKAATAMGVQQPTVSRRIESLEAKIGAKLFDRGSRGPVLTYEGQRMLSDVDAAEIFLNRAASRARHAEQIVEGECKLMMSDGLASAWFARFFLPIFVARHPNVEVRLCVTTEGGRSSIPPFDVQVQYAPALDSDLVTTRVGTFHFAFFASQSYLDSYGEPRTIDDLVGHRLVDVTASLTSKGRWATYSDAAAVGRTSIFTNSGAIAAESVLSGTAIGFLPSYAFLTAPGFVPILREFHHPTGIYVTFARDAGERSSVRAMLNFLRTVTFDRRRMSWFADEFECPGEQWRPLFTELLADALTPESE